MTNPPGQDPTGGILSVASYYDEATGTRDGIGIQLINGFARQLGAKLEVEQGVGTRYLVQMRLRHDRPDPPRLGA